MVIQFATGSGTTNKKGALFRFCENDQTPEVNTMVSGYNTKTLRSKCYSSIKLYGGSFPSVFLFENWLTVQCQGHYKNVPNLEV